MTREQEVRALKQKLLDRDGDHITMYAVHKGTGLSYTHVVRIFNRKRRPSLEAASKIANFLGISINTLYATLKGEDSEH